MIFEVTLTHGWLQSSVRRDAARRAGLSATAELLVLFIKFIEFTLNIGQTYFLVDRESVQVWLEDRLWMILVALYAVFFVLSSAIHYV